MHAVTVPGAIDAWAALLAGHGTIDLKEALKPAIRLAERRADDTARRLRLARDVKDYSPTTKADEAALSHQRAAARAGEVMRYPALAHTLRLIGEKGRDGFYAGEVADEIVAHLEQPGRPSLPR